MNRKIILPLLASLIITLSVIQITNPTKVDSMNKEIKSTESIEDIATGANMTLELISDLGYHFIAEDDDNIKIFVPLYKQNKYDLKDAKEGMIAYIKHVDNKVINITLEK